MSGTADGGSTVAFDPHTEHNRPALTLANGIVYVAYAASCPDELTPFHGWVFAYEAGTLTQQGIFATTPNGDDGGIWMTGDGLAADESGNIYASDGNGTFDTLNIPATDVGSSVFKLTLSNGALNLTDYFTPYNQDTLSLEDKDLGSGGVLLLPVQPGPFPHEMIAAGKEGRIYLINRDEFTALDQHYCANCSTDPQIVQESSSDFLSTVFSTPVYWNSTLYYWTPRAHLSAIPMVNGSMNFDGVTQNQDIFGFPGANLSVSANGNSNGILWALGTDAYSTGGAAVLRAYDATNVSNRLYSSDLKPNDAAGPAVKFSAPIVANGKVYVGSANELTVYGLTGATPTPTATPTSSSSILATPTPSSTANPSTTPTATATDTATATVTATPTATATANGITRNGSNKGGFSGFSPTTVNLYAGTANDDLVVVALCVGDSAINVTPPSGYTQLGSNQQFGTYPSTCGLYYHVWQTGDTLAPSFSDDGSFNDHFYIATSYSGADTNAPFDPNATPSQNGANIGSVTLSAVSPNTSEDMLVFFGFENTNGGGSYAPIYTSPLAQYNSEQIDGSWEELFAADGPLISSGSTGDQTMIAAGANETGGFMIAIQPPTGTVPTPTSTGTAASTATLSATAIPPTITPTATVTVTATATDTAIATATATPTATAIANGITRNGTNQGGFSGFSPTTVNLYADTANNDLVVVAVCVGNSPITITPPSGYSELGSEQQFGTYLSTCGLYYHVWQTGDTLAPSFSDDDAGFDDRYYITTSYSGANTSSPFDPNATPSENGVNTESVTLSAVSPNTSEDMLVFFGFENTNGGGSYAPIYTSPLAQYNSEQIDGSWEELFAADGPLNSSGSTGDQTMIAAGANETGGFMIAIQPANGATPTPTATASETVTDTPTATATETATTTATATQTATATATQTATATSTATITSTATATDTATQTGTPTATATATRTATATGTATRTATPTATTTATRTATATGTATRTATPTATTTATRSATATGTATRTATPTATTTATRSATATGTATRTATPTTTPTPAPRAVASLSVSVLNFGSQAVGTTSSAKSVILTNTGNATLNIASITKTGDFAQTNNCRATLGSGKNCSISVTFRPTSSGLRSGTLAINDNAAGSPQTVSLGGNFVTALPAPLSFGSVTRNTTSEKLLTVTNNQAVGLSALSASISGTGFRTNSLHSTCSSTLAAGSSCVYAVTFTPTTKKSSSGTLTITDNPDPGSPHSLSLTGNGS